MGGSGRPPNPRARRAPAAPGRSSISPHGVTRGPRYTGRVAEVRRYQSKSDAANRLILDLLDVADIPLERRGCTSSS